MAKTIRNDYLWEVGCEGHVDAWVVAPNWEQATVEAAKFWGVRWGSVAARCVEKSRIKGYTTNICCRCGRTYYAAPPLCAACKAAVLTEEAETVRRVNLAYKMGRAM